MTAEIVKGELELHAPNGHRVSVRKTATGGVWFVGEGNEKPYIDGADFDALITYLKSNYPITLSPTRDIAPPVSASAIRGVAPPTLPSPQAKVDIKIKVPTVIIEFFRIVQQHVLAPFTPVIEETVVFAQIAGASEFDIGMEAADLENELQATFTDNVITVSRA